MTSCVEDFVESPLLAVRLTHDVRLPQPAGPMRTSTSAGSNPDPLIVSLNGVYCFAGDGSVATFDTDGAASVGRLCKTLSGDPLPILTSIPPLAFPVTYSLTAAGVGVGCC